MGNLTPGAKYIYESPDGGKTVYSRVEGQTERKLIGHSPVRYQSLEEVALWRNIHMAALGDPVLQKALEQCIILYHLKHSPEELQYHPV